MDAIRLHLRFSPGLSCDSLEGLEDLHRYTCILLILDFRSLSNYTLTRCEGQPGKGNLCAFPFLAKSPTVLPHYLDHGSQNALTAQNLVIPKSTQIVIFQHLYN
jgi:hypothetical protein